MERKNQFPQSGESVWKRFERRLGKANTSEKAQFVRDK